MVAPRVVSTERVDRARCIRLLQRADLGRIIHTVDALPAVLLAHYRMDGESVLAEVMATSALVATGRSDVVAFEVDHVDRLTNSPDSDRVLWWVVVTGHAVPVPDRGHCPPASAGMRYLQIRCDLVAGFRSNIRPSHTDSVAPPR